MILSLMKISIKKDKPLLELAISGRHKEHSLWLLTQSYTAVLKNIKDKQRCFTFGTLTDLMLLRAAFLLVTRFSLLVTRYSLQTYSLFSKVYSLFSKVYSLFSTIYSLFSTIYSLFSTIYSLFLQSTRC